ncbi:MAG: hypothetical protein U0791_18585 [Gemmataceae bacterium]
MNPERDIPIPPECGPTVERIQSVLDRVHPASILSADAHASSCAACRSRVASALRMMELFAEPVSVRSGFADSILVELAHHRRIQYRRKAAAVFGGFAMAAAIGLALWMNQPKDSAVAKVEPPPAEPQRPAPPIRVNDELVKATEAIRESTRAVTEPAEAAPRLVASLTDTLLKAPTVPVGYDLGPAGKSLADIPEAAKSGLEPVGNTAQKAFNRLLRDVTAMKPKT